MTSWQTAVISEINNIKIAIFPHNYSGYRKEIWQNDAQVVSVANNAWKFEFLKSQDGGPPLF